MSDAAQAFRPARARQAWAIAKIELRRVFFAKRSLWVFALALLPSVIFFGHGIDVKLRAQRFASRGTTTPALLDSITEGERIDDVKKRLGKPASELVGNRVHRVRQKSGNGGTPGTTAHVIEPAVEARFVRLNVFRPTYNGEPTARIYEFEVYGPDSGVNLARGRPATGSLPCKPDQGADKAVNGSVSGGENDRWCAQGWPLFLQVDLETARPVARFLVKHASAGGEDEERDTREFNIQLSTDGKIFRTVASSSGAGFVDERTEIRELIYFDGRRTARLLYVDGRMERRDVHPCSISKTTAWSSRGSFSTSTCGSRSSSAASASSCICSAAR